MRGRKLTVLAVAAMLVLTGCVAEEQEPEPEPLTVSEAGARYLEAVCPVNSAWDAVDVEVDRLRVERSRGETGNTDPLGAALAKLERRTLTAAEMLGDSSVAWPGAAESAVEAVRETLESDAEQAGSVAKLSGEELAAYRWVGAGDISSAAAEARRALGLPEDPAAACEAS